MALIVRIDDMRALLASWDEMLRQTYGRCDHFNRNSQVLDTLDQWPRIKWFYYCDDQDGNTLRVYDSEHLNRLGRVHYDRHRYYLEPDGVHQGHYERVIIRGKNMWSVDESQRDLNRPESLRNRFRNNVLWVAFPSGRAPIRDGAIPPPQLGLPVRAGNPQTVDVTTGMRRDRRLWYFEHLNQLPPFEPAHDLDPSFVDPDDDADLQELRRELAELRRQAEQTPEEPTGFSEEP